MDSKQVSKQLIQDAKRRRADPRAVWGLSWGFAGLDTITGGIHAGQLSLLAARPGVGKSLLAGQVALAVAQYLVGDDGATRYPDACVRLILCEMSAQSFQDRMVCQLAEVRSSRVRSGSLTDDEFSRYVAAAKQLAVLPIEYLDDTTSLAETRRFIEGGEDGRTCAWWMVDYIGIHPAGAGIDESNMYRKVSYLSAGFRDLARDVAPGLVLTQLNRQVEGREDKRPRLADLRDSGSLEQDASGPVIGLYREDIYLKLDESSDPEAVVRPKPAEALVLKHRYGMLGTVGLTWVPLMPGFKDDSALVGDDPRLGTDPVPDDDEEDEDA